MKRLLERFLGLPRRPAAAGYLAESVAYSALLAGTGEDAPVPDFASFVTGPLARGAARPRPFPTVSIPGARS